MEIGQGREGAALVLEPRGRLDSFAAAQFEQSLTQAADAAEKRVVVDFAGLDYISSAGLRALLAGAKSLQAAGGGVALCGLNLNVREVFEISGFTSIFTTRDDRAAAARALA